MEVTDQDKTLLRVVTVDTLEAIETKFAGKFKGAEATRLKCALLTSRFSNKAYAEALEFTATEKDLAEEAMNRAFAD